MANRKGGGGGTSNNIKSFITLILIAAIIFGWSKVNHINSIGGVYDYFKAWSDKIFACASADGEGLAPGWVCNVTGNGGGSSSKGGEQSIPGTNSKPKPTGPAREDVSYNPPVGNTVNERAPKFDDNYNTAMKGLDSIKIAPEDTKAAYKRSEWRHWIGTPCNTRLTVLINQGENVKVQKTAATCKITSGTWKDVYHNNDKITDYKTLDIDHMIPLGYAAKHGGQAWDANKKEKFANDLSQLMAVSAKENRSKSDKGPSEYMPTDNFKCQYSKIWVATALKYGVWIEGKDKETLRKGLSLCQKG